MNIKLIGVDQNKLDQNKVSQKGLIKKGHLLFFALLERFFLWAVPVVAMVLALASVAAFAGGAGHGVFSDDSGSVAVSSEAQDRWGFAYENDFFVPGGKDQDYTFGLALSYHSSKFNDALVRSPLVLIDRALGFNRSPSRKGFEAGLYGFTPSDKHGSQINLNDRPFSSLVYFSTVHERYRPKDQVVLRTQLSAGALGLNAVGQLQKEFHSLIGNDEPEGWDNQISQGGELTARYSVSRQALLGGSSEHIELRHTQTASVGYLTEASWGMSVRVGKLNSAWHDFNPDIASYAESSASANRGRQERFFWAGVAVKARAYNAFLQGQFHQSEHSYTYSDLRHVVVEAWAGYTQSFANGYFVSYGLRGHSSELRVGEADRSVIWGGLMLGRVTI